LRVQYYLYRYHTPEMQLWMSRDPIDDVGFALSAMRDRLPAEHRSWANAFTSDQITPNIFAPSVAEFANGYGFVRGDPINRVDAWSLFPCLLDSVDQTNHIIQVVTLSLDRRHRRASVKGPL
jgi:hypothetical protein